MSVEVAAIDKSKAMQVSDVFDQAYNEGLVHQSVTAYLANARTWTAKRKSRSDARGGGAKPWRQKGTGRARAGTSRSPIWVGGGKTFAPKEINYSHKMNKKAHKASMRSLISQLIRDEKIKVFESLELAEAKTKEFIKATSEWQTGSGRTLVIMKDLSEQVYLASRNAANFDVVDCYMVNVYMLMSYKNIVIQKEALTVIEEQLK